MQTVPTENMLRHWRKVAGSLSKISKIERHGTFVNGELLSPEGFKSELYKLKSDDILECRIDIVAVNLSTIAHSPE